MFTLIPGIILFMLGIAGWLLSRRLKKNTSEDVIFGFSQTGIWVGVLLFLIVIGNNFDEITADRQSTFKYYKLTEVRQIYIGRSEVIATEFKHYLGDLYPDFESKVFEGIGPKSMMLYLAKYPELKTIEAVKVLTEEIKSLQDAVYGQDLKIAELKRSVRYRRVNPWALSWLFPPLPEWAAVKEGDYIVG